MGTFGSYSGNMCIQEKKRKEFTRNILKVLSYGGMMQFDKVNIYGKEILLIKPVELNQEGEAIFHFNYFEDDRWESAYYRLENGSFGSGKIGGGEFCNVVTAVHVLYELYDESCGLTKINGDIVESSAYVGWINCILGTDFSMKKRMRLWDTFEYYHLNLIEDGRDAEDERYDLRDIVPASLYPAMGGTEFSDICYITNGTETLRKEEIKPNSYPEAVYQCKESLKRYFDNSSENEKEQIEKIWEIVRSEKNIRKNIEEKELRAIAKMSLILPARVFVYLVCEIKKLSFWKTWNELHKDVYRDEVMEQYASSELMAERTAAIESQVEPMATSEFLRDDNSFTFWNNPEELKGKPNYYLSDADRMFWWDGSEEVLLSEDMDKWLSDLSQRHKNLMDEIAPESWDKECFMKKLIFVLAETDAYYKRIYAFQNMFYEFLQNGNDNRYIAAVLLLEKLAEENKEAGKIIEKVKSWWDITSKNVTHNAGRMAMKRYLSVMANRRLREKYFGF